MTEFQKTILRIIAHANCQSVSVDVIAGSLPGWSRPSARGVLVAHVRRACQAMQKAGWVVFWHAQGDQWDNGRAALTEVGRKLLSI